MIIITNKHNHRDDKDIEVDGKVVNDYQNNEVGVQIPSTRRTVTIIMKMM